MSLLQNEDFAIYRIRSRYLQTVRDGVGDRLITLNPTALNLPGFRNAGWGNPADIKRTHSPPIGTTTDYLASFHHREKPTPVVEETSEQPQWEAAKKDGEEESEFLPGRVPVNDHIGRPLQRPPTRQDDESSDSDSGDDDETGPNGAMQQIQFSKMPLRTRSGSSPIRSIRTGPQVLITSPSKNEGNRIRSGSHGALEFARRAANQERQSRRARAGTDSDSDAFQFDRRTRSSLSSYDVVRFEDPGEESDDSAALSSEFTETADSNPSVMKNPFNRMLRPPMSTTPTILNDLPPARPISQIQPISALTQLLRAKKPGNALYDYSIFSGKGELRPLDCRIYCPKSKQPVQPMKILLRRDQRTDKGIKETTVADAIGFALYTYIEENKEPPLSKEQCDINRWTFRMVEDDGEVDYDFPPLDRLKPITGYIPKDRRGAQRGPGEFALVAATPEQYEEHQRVTPVAKPVVIEESIPEEPAPTASTTKGPDLLAASAPPAVAPTRTGPTRILRIFMNTVDDFAKTVGLSVTTDTTFSEVLDLVCKKKHLNKAEFVLKIFGTSSIVSGDKTVETLGEDKDLELIRRSYREAPNLGVGSRTPSSFTTPVLQSTQSTAPIAKKKTILQPHGGTPDLVFSLGYQKFIVYRRQPMSFINRHERVLAIDGEYVHVMPSDSKTIFESPKTISLHISSIVGCKISKKNPNNFRIAVLKSEPRETKLYDFEAVNSEQAFEIVNALKEKLETYKMDHPLEPRYFLKNK